MSHTLSEDAPVSEPAFLTKTRASYDAVAADYASRFTAELPGKPLDRALLEAFTELVPDGPVVDVGCGPGHVTAFLAGRGADVSGVDLSPGMVEAARRAHPELRFEVGSMFGLDLADGSLAGLVAYYSIVNIPRAELPAVFAEFARVLAPGGVLLMAFQAGDDERHGTSWFGHEVDVHLYRNQPDVVARLLAEAGLPLKAQMVRQPENDGVENGPRAYLLATRLSGSA